MFRRGKLIIIKIEIYIILIHYYYYHKEHSN